MGPVRPHYAERKAAAWDVVLDGESSPSEIEDAVTVLLAEVWDECNSVYSDFLSPDDIAQNPYRKDA